jgi:hypothetical protein
MTTQEAKKRLTAAFPDAVCHLATLYKGDMYLDVCFRNSQSYSVIAKGHLDEPLFFRAVAVLRNSIRDKKSIPLAAVDHPNHFVVR